MPPAPIETERPSKKPLLPLILFLGFMIHMPILPAWAEDPAPALSHQAQPVHESRPDGHPEASAQTAAQGEPKAPDRTLAVVSCIATLLLIIGTLWNHRLKKELNARKGMQVRLGNILDASPMGIHHYRLEPDGRLVFMGANSTADTILGVDNQAFIGKTIEDAFPPLVDTDIPERYCSVCITGEPWITDHFDYEDGKIKGAYHVQAIPTEPGHIAAMFFDITEQKKAEWLLKERELLYRSLFEKNVSVMLLIDPDSGTIVDANPSACAYYGYSKATLTGMRITQINTLSKKEVFDEMQRATSEKRSYFNFSHRLSDGSIRQVEVFSGPITVSGKPLLCSTVHDISERKLAEKERERLIEDLQIALSEVKTLRGFLPICMSCKKIRDDKGYWNQIETYIHQHSDARFSHGICPDCAKKIYPELDIHR